MKDERAFRLRLCGFQLRRGRGGCCNVLLGLVAGFVKQGQAGFRQVAFVGNLPFVLGFDEHRAGQPQQCGELSPPSNRTGFRPDAATTAHGPRFRDNQTGMTPLNRRVTATYSAR